MKSFHIKVITPNGDIVPYQNCRALRGESQSYFFLPKFYAVKITELISQQIKALEG